MQKDKWDEILEELSEKRLDKIFNATKPMFSSSKSMGISSGPNFDFASLYPSTMRFKIPLENERVKKIKKLLNDIND